MSSIVIVKIDTELETEINSQSRPRSRYTWALLGVYAARTPPQPVHLTCTQLAIFRHISVRFAWCGVS